VDPSSDTCGSERRFAVYVAELKGAFGHADREAPFQSYCTGLLLPGDRKSVEPMAGKRPLTTAVCGAAPALTLGYFAQRQGSSSSIRWMG
jgi:SRSO17 transposase